MKKRNGLWTQAFFVLLFLSAAIFAPFGGKAEAAVADHILTETVDPDGITVNLFDYWLTEQGEPGNRGSRDSNIGINQGHSLKFGASGGSGINGWGGGPINQGIVSALLGEDGYPVLAGNGGESLAYLFDPNNRDSADYKAAYENITGLFQVNMDTGNYYYNSKENYAVYNAADHTFDVYDTWGVRHHTDNADREDGYFFPFTSAEQVFTEDASGNLQHTSLTCNNEAMNHFFGMTMTAEFIQPAQGLVTLPGDGTQGDPMKFQFTGDDDIWVFIDGVLVMDIGGIHNSATGTIDFSTGDIVIKNPGQSDITTNIRECFMKAQGNGFNSSQFSGNTFIDNSYHTLQVFYLERGAGASNLQIDFNMKSQPENSIYKMDQYGNGISDVVFALYAADSDYNISSELEILTAVTDAGGKIVFRDESRKPYDFSRGDASVEHYYVLRERTGESRLPGYRASGDIYLRYTTDGQLLVSNKWESGAMSNFSVTVTERGTVRDLGDNVISADQLRQGTVFAVIFRKSENSWYPLTGSNMGGWTMGQGSGPADAIEAAKKNPLIFREEDGLLTVTVDEVPGDITEYYYVNLSDEQNAKYVVRYFFTEGSLENASTGNTRELDLADFERNFSSNIWVANIKNELTVKKVDESGASLPGAVFSIYRAEDVSDGVVIEGRTPYDTVTTGADGTAAFPSTGHILDRGVYYLEETQAPEGYLAHSGLVKVIVDDTGVYADAGTEGDGVRVHTGVGYLLKPLEKFGANDDIDATLHDIYIVAQTAGSASQDSLDWGELTGEETQLHLMYGKDGNLLQYGPYEDGKEPYLTADTGFIRARVYQCFSEEHASVANKTDLQGEDISNLFTGSTMVEVTNEKKTASVAVKKEVDGTGAEGDTQRFEFTLTLSGKDGTALSQATVLYTGTGTVTGGTPVSGEDGQGFSAVTDENGQIRFTLEKDQQVQFAGIEEGASFTVEEADYGDQGYDAAYTLTYGTQTGQKEEGRRASGTASYDAPVNVLFTNTRKFLDFSFIKTDGKSDGQTAPLEGASFLLYRWTGNGQPGTAPIDPDAPGTGWQRVTESPVVSGTDGRVWFKDLIEGITYRLIETAAPEGYITPAGQWNLTYKKTGEDSGWEIVMAADGTKAPPGFIEQDSRYMLPNYGIQYIPSSGGRGITLFAAAGTLLIGGAALLLSVWAKRRKV